MISSLEGLQLVMERLRLDLVVIKRTRDKGQEPWHVAFGQPSDRTHGRLGTGSSIAEAAEEAITAAEAIDANDTATAQSIRQERAVRRIAIGDYVVLGEGECVRVTDRAALIEIDSASYWFPLSVLRDAPYTGWTGEVICKRWFAEKESLV